MGGVLSLRDRATNGAGWGGYREDFVGVDAGARMGRGESHSLLADVGADIEDEVAVLEVVRRIGGRGRPRAVEDVHEGVRRGGGV